MLKPCPRCESDNLSVTNFKYEGKPAEGLNHLTFRIFTMIHCKDCGAAITRSTIDWAYECWNKLPRGN